jgi:hypothetical protein
MQAEVYLRWYAVAREMAVAIPFLDGGRNNLPIQRDGPRHNARPIGICFCFKGRTPRGLIRAGLIVRLDKAARCCFYI